MQYTWNKLLFQIFGIDQRTWRRFKEVSKLRVKYRRINLKKSTGASSKYQGKVVNSETRFIFKAAKMYDLYGFFVCFLNLRFAGFVRLD